MCNRNGGEKGSGLSGLRVSKDLDASSALRISVEGQRPRIAPPDGLFWSVLAKFWSQGRKALFFTQPRMATLWQQKRFRYYCRALSQGGRPGRQKIAPELRKPIRRMWRSNPTWGPPRIVAELHKLGIDVAKSTVDKYKPGEERLPFAIWRTFLDLRLKELVAVEFFVVPTATFKVLFVFLVLAHDRRRIVHFNVTEHPPAQWTGRQIVEAFPFDTVPEYLLRDGDGIYGDRVRRRLTSLGIDEIVTAPASPWQIAYVDHLIGSLRRELLDHVIILNERYLRGVLSSYLDYYHPGRTHRSLDQDAPDGRRVRLAQLGQIVEFPVVQGFHHYYLSRAA